MTFLPARKGASIVVAATDDRQARIVLSSAVRMTELDPDLAGRRRY
jgi:hypothetical protein